MSVDSFTAGALKWIYKLIVLGYDFIVRCEIDVSSIHAQTVLFPYLGVSCPNANGH